MATKLKNMKLTSVDLVRAGANQEADICLYKSADPPEATESPTEEEKNIFKRFIAFIRGTPTEADVEPHSPIEKAEESDETPDLEYLYKSALAESLHSIMQDDTITKADKKNMAERSLRQYAEKIRELDEDEAMERELLEDTYDDDLDGDFDDYYDFEDDEDEDDDDRYDDIEEIEVSKYNHNHGRDGKFTTSGGGGVPAGGTSRNKVDQVTLEHALKEPGNQGGLNRIMLDDTPDGAVRPRIKAYEVKSVGDIDDRGYADVKIGYSLSYDVKRDKPINNGENWSDVYRTVHQDPKTKTIRLKVAPHKY